MNNKNIKEKRIAIIGAGITGLNLAWKLSEYGFDVEIFEKKDYVGGVGTSVTIDGYSFEYGPHMFHTVFDDILNDFKELMKNENYSITMLDREIKYNGKYYKYPLKIINVLKGLGFFTSVRCGLSFFYSLLKRKLKLTKDISAEDWFINNFGKVGYEIYFKDYTYKVWGVHPKNLSPIFPVSRIPGINIRKILKDIFFKVKSTKFTDDFGESIYCPDMKFIYYPYNGMRVI
ncbi:hypothetical protein DRQ09_08170, partial [candidate division KSB1 bacterium]